MNSNASLCRLDTQMHGGSFSEAPGAWRAPTPHSPQTPTPLDGEAEPNPEEIEQLFKLNKKWASDMVAQDPTYFSSKANEQKPTYLYLGCSDSRVPAQEMLRLHPGEMFVHRNIANIVHSTDFNFLSVLQFAVEVLGVRHIVVCGHYGCGGVKAALFEKEPLGLIDNWLMSVKAVYREHQAEMDKLMGEDEDMALRRLCELNVLEQTKNICRTSIVQKAWSDPDRQLYVHSWIYDLEDGLLNDLYHTLDKPHHVHDIYHKGQSKVNLLDGLSTSPNKASAAPSPAKSV